MSSWVITKTAEAVSESFSAYFETEITSMFIKSSRLRSVRSAVLCCDHAGRENGRERGRANESPCTMTYGNCALTFFRHPSALAIWARTLAALP